MLCPGRTKTEGKIKLGVQPAVSHKDHVERICEGCFNILFPQSASFHIYFE